MPMQEMQEMQVGSLSREDPERLLLNHAKTLGSLASGGEEFNPGPEVRLGRSELLCNKSFTNV